MRKYAAIDKAGCGSDKNAAALEVYLPFLGKIGKLWQTFLIVDYSNATENLKTAVEVAENKLIEENAGIIGRSIRIHIARSPDHHLIGNGLVASVSSIFGYRFADGPVNYRLPTQVDLWSAVRTPEGYCIVQIKGQEIYILIDPIADKIERPEEALGILIHLAIASIYARQPEDLRNKILNRAARIIRRNFRKNRRLALKAIEDFIEEGTDRNIESNKAEIEWVGSSLKTVSASLFELRKDIAEINVFLNVSPQTIRREYEKTLELIKRIEGVRTIGIKGDWLIIFTQPLIQKYGEKKKEYDIGSYAVILKPAVPDHNGIGIVQEKPGLYVNTHVPIPEWTSGIETLHFPICFGQDVSLGLNTAFDKLMADFELPTLVHMLLDFLRFDDVAPTYIASSKKRLPIEIQLDTSSDGGPEFKKQFIEYMRKVSGQKRQDFMKSRLDAAIAQEEKIASEWGNLRKTKTELDRCRGYLENLKKNIPYAALCQLEKFLKNKRVLSVEKQNGLRVYLWDDAGCSISVIWFDYSRAVWFLSSEGPDYTEWADQNHRFSIPPQKSHKSKRFASALARMDYARFVSRFCGYRFLEKGGES